MTTAWEQTASLASGLLMRWGIHGHRYDAATAARLATLLQENGFTNMVQLDYIKWTVEKSLVYGFNPGDIQPLIRAQIRGGTHWHSLVHNIDAHCPPTDTRVHKSVTVGMVNFDLERWCVAQPKVDELPPPQRRSSSLVGRCFAPLRR